MDDVASGGCAYLKTLTDVTALLGAFPANDSVAANASQPWVFNVGEVGEILHNMEGSSTVAGSSAIALGLCSAGSFSGGVAGFSAQFERLSVEFWVDPLRDAANNITESSGATRLRGMACYYTVDHHLHRTEPGDNVVWGDLVTVGCQRLVGPPTFYAVPDGDGVLRGQAYYAVTISGHIGATV